MKIYLAGPEVFLPDSISTGESLKALCKAHKATGLYPTDNAIPPHILDATLAVPPTAPPYDHQTPRPSVPAWIREKNMQMIRESDAIVANMTPFRGPSMDVGTAYEMGVAAALGKIVIGYADEGGRKPYLRKVVEGGLCSSSSGGGVVSREGSSSWVETAEKARGRDGRVWDAAGMSVEEFEGCDLLDNLMMACGVDNTGGVICASAEGAIAMAVAVFEERGGKL